MTEEELIRRKKRKRMIERRRRRQRKKRMILCGLLLAAILIIGCVLFGIVKLVGALTGNKKDSSTKQNTANIEDVIKSNGDPADGESASDEDTKSEEDGETNPDLPDDEETAQAENEEADNAGQSSAGQALGPYMTSTIQVADGYTFNKTSSTKTFPQEETYSGAKDKVMTSDYAILVDIDDNSIVGEKGINTRISPASMTKIMTMLVAAEHVQDINDTFTMTIEITDFSYSNDCMAVGFLVGEEVTVKDLMYGTMLPSGGDAALGLATYVAGSQEAFVELMNRKAAELGLSSTTHFTNVMGIYNDDHYSSVYDIAVIMKAAMENDLCREVMSCRVYTTTSTPEHPDGITISNWFLRRIEDKVTDGEVLCAKTGFVVQSRNCSASFYISPTGKQYIAVTAGASSSWRCIFDHSSIYKRYTS